MGGVVGVSTILWDARVGMLARRIQMERSQIRMNKRGVFSLRLGLSLGLTVLLISLLIILGSSSLSQSADKPTEATPLLVLTAQKEVRVFGHIFPARFNAAKGPEAQYHFLVWQAGTSPGALIETPADDLDFHDAILGLGAQPGNNLTMAAWTGRHDHDNPAPKQTVSGSQLDIRIAWSDNPNGLSIDQVFSQPPTPNPQPLSSWRFSGNRDRWFNTIPLVPRPGCLMCLYSCPSGKVSNGALSIADYVHEPQRFHADTDQLPPDGTAVIVTFQIRS